MYDTITAILSTIGLLAILLVCSWPFLDDIYEEVFGIVSRKRLQSSEALLKSSNETCNRLLSDLTKADTKLFDCKEELNRLSAVIGVRTHDLEVAQSTIAAFKKSKAKAKPSTKRKQK